MSGVSNPLAQHTHLEARAVVGQTLDPGDEGGGGDDEVDETQRLQAGERAAVVLCQRVSAGGRWGRGDGAMSYQGAAKLDVGCAVGTYRLLLLEAERALLADGVLLGPLQLLHCCECVAL
jgi:hypothetical protein